MRPRAARLKPSRKKKPKRPNSRVGSHRRAGGSATASGMNFQAAVTALAAVYVARGRPLGWLEGHVDDVPVSLLAETGGPGDDVQLNYRNGLVAEIQIKRGLQTGKGLWTTLLKLSGAIHAGTISFGVLVVSPDSSRAITKTLSRDIKRLADGRSDGLGEIAKTFRSKLEAAGLPVQMVCERLRVVAIHALHMDDASVRMARAELEHLCRDKTRISQAWDRLYRDAAELIELRGRRSASSVIRILRSAGVEIASDAQDTPGTVLATLTDWVFSANAYFSIFGVAQPLLIDKSWIPIKTVVRATAGSEDGGLAEALERYHAWDKHQPSRDSTFVDPETLGRFFRHAVVVAGPGMGKSTLLTKLARRYAEDGYPVLRVSLSAVAARMKTQGSSFSEGLFALGLDGSGLTGAAAQSAGLTDWVLLCDGLDECGAEQEMIVQAILRFVAGHPDCRVIVTTRPIGYGSALLRTWRHYELVPLEVDAAANHLAGLVRSIVPENHPAHRETLSLVTAHLGKSRASGLIVRSPLLLGMAASLIVRNSTLGQTKAQLYDKFFELIDSAPNIRTTTAPASSSVLQRFLNILGWDLLTNPLSRPTATIERCANQLVPEMGCTSLQARETAEKCLKFWQDAGMLERVQHAGEETITFIHKTFGEFAAARYLQSLPSESQRRIVAATLDQDAWSEVLNFAGSLGLATLIGAEMLERREPAAVALQMTKRALVLASEADIPPEPTIRKLIIERAFTYVRSERRMWAYEVGKGLVPVGERFPSEVGGPAASLLDNEQPWTRLVAWACVVTAGPNYYELERLKEALSALPHLAEPAMRSSLAGGNVLGGGSRDLAQQFALRAAREILDRCPPEEADALLPDALNAEPLGTMGFHMQISALLEEKGKNYKIGKFPISANWLTSMMEPGGYAEAHKISCEKIFGTLDDVGISTDAKPDEVAPKVLLHLSAFLIITDFWEMPASDVWTWHEAYDEDAVKEVLRGIVYVSSIEHDRLVRDVRIFLKLLKATPPKDVYRVFDQVADVDAPTPDWGRAKGLNLDCTKLEAALRHRSVWLVPLAANLLAHAADGEALRASVGRLFVSGSGLALWAAAQLATFLERTVAAELAYKRLRGPLVPGCEYLFALLRKLKVEFDGALLSVLRNGLMTGNADIAISSAKLALEFAKPDASELNDLLLEAYRHWLEHEEPYPTQGGVVPRSPRAQLLSALLNIKAPGHRELLDYASDVRSDVKEIGKAALLKRVTESEEARELIIDAAVNGAISATLLREALLARAPFGPPQVQRLCNLLSSSDSKLRYAALGVLDSTYLTRNEIELLARARTADPEPEIRDAALRLLD